MTRYDLIVTGAGAAGLMAAGQAAQRGAKVLLLDKNARVGRKLLITGKGRCNLTNNCTRDRLMEAVRRNPRFLYSAFDAFSPQDVMRFFEEQGVALKTERGQRVFPASDRAADIVDALDSFCRRHGVTFKQGRAVEVTVENGAAAGVATASGERFSAPAVLLATGGKSYPLTGSTGDGYRIAASLGHIVVEPSASLVPIVAKEPWCGELMGLSLKNVTLSVKRSGRELYRDIGELMFTHFGLSGPLALTASSYLDGVMGDFRLSIDLKPGLTCQQLDARVLRDFSQAKNRAVKNALDRLLLRRLIPVALQLAGVDASLPVNSVSRQDRANLVQTIKNLTVTPAALRPVEEAVVTRGGIATAQVDPKTMQSKIVRGLYFAGELLDVDALTGGFNLQIAFSTGYLAALCAAKQ